MEDIEIRIAELTDLDGLCNLEAATFDPAKYHMLSRRQFRYLLTKGNADILVAIYEGKIVGAAILFYRKTSRFGRLYSLAVHSSLQKRSIGRLLFEVAEKTMMQRGLKGLLCEFRQDEAQLSDFYKKMGCQPIGILKNYYADGMIGIKTKKIFKQ